MRVIVAITVPDHVIDDVDAVLARTPVPRGEFDRVERASLMLPVFWLGNLSRPEVASVGEMLRAEVDHSGPPARVRFSGVWALETEGNPTVGLPLVGDAEQVSDVARTLATLVSRLGYFVDRRRWAPRLTIGSVTATTSLPFLERLVADLETYTSPAWSVTSVELMRQQFDESQPGGWQVLESIPTATIPA